MITSYSLKYALGRLKKQNESKKQFEIFQFFVVDFFL